MKKWNKVIVLMGIFFLMSTGFAGSGQALAGQRGENVNQIGGAVIGGVAGGIIGSQIGKGSGRTAAIIGGTLAGAALGSYVGGYMDRADQEYMSRALETRPTGEAVSWQNPDTGYQYQFTPVRTYKTPEGQYCREFTTQVTIGGEIKDAYGTACRMPDGSWKIRGSESEPAVKQPYYEEHHYEVHQHLYFEKPRMYHPGYKVKKGPPGRVKIPKGHLPPPGLCRIWYPGHPPGQQPPPGNCAVLSRQVPRGAWLISR